MVNNICPDGRNTISGKVIFDNEYNIISADETFYRFISPMMRKITDTIHQIDMDDFFEVINDLSTYSVSTMVMRMRRFDNTYRWVIAVLRYPNVNSVAEGRYVEMEISDIINLNNHYIALTRSFNHESVSLAYDETESLDEMLNIAKEYNKDNRDDQINFGLIEIDNQESLAAEYGDDFIKELRDELCCRIYEALGSESFISHSEDGCVGFYVINIGTEVNMRSFIEAIRNQILWKYISSNKRLEVRFSIGISEYPRNGRDIDNVIAKMFKARELAISKGRGRYIIYKEDLHGEL